MVTEWGAGDDSPEGVWSLAMRQERHDEGHGWPEGWRAPLGDGEQWEGRGCPPHTS